MHAPPIPGSPLNSRAANLSVPQPPQRTSIGRPISGFPPGVKDLSPSVTITPAPPQPPKVIDYYAGYIIISFKIANPSELCCEHST